MTEERKHYFQVVRPEDASPMLFEMVGKLHDRMDTVTNQLKDAVTEMRQQREGIERLLDGFPESDPVSHRKEHEESLRRLRAKADFWEKMKWEITKYGLVVFIGWLAVEAWKTFLRGPQG